MGIDIWIGIDPGVNGAVAVLDNDLNVLLLEKFPTIKEKKTSSGHKTTFVFPEMASLFKKISDLPGNKFVFLENVSAMPRDGVSSAFTFGGSFWAIQQVLACNNLPYLLVSSKRWQSVMLQQCPKDRNERLELYRAQAIRQHPTQSGNLSRKSDADKAAALLIAHYGKRTYIPDFNAVT